MGKRGPRKKPSKIEKIEGNPGKRAVVDLGIDGLGEVFIPEHLPDDAVGCIEVIKSGLPPDVFSKIDSFVLSAFAFIWSEHKAVVHRMSDPTFQRVVSGSSGSPVLNPLCRYAVQLSLALASLGDRIGVGPKARQELKLPSEKPQSKFGSLVGRPGSSASLNS